MSIEGLGPGWRHAYIGAAVGHHTIEGCEEDSESAQPSEEQESVKDRQVTYTARCQRCQYSCRTTPACAQATINTLLLHLSISPKEGKLTTRDCRGTVLQREEGISMKIAWTVTESSMQQGYRRV